MTRPKFLAVLVLGLTLFAGSCGGAGGGGKPTAGSEGSEAGPTSAVGSTLVVSVHSEPENLQPDAKVNDAAYSIDQNIFNKLVTIDYNWQVKPDLAQSWEVSDDGLTYTFHLVQGVKWSDGQPFTSADVVWTLNQIVNNHGAMAPSLPIASVTAPDDYTVVVKLQHKDAAFLGFLSWYGTFILPKHVYEGTDWLTNPANQKPVGTGPFVLQEWQKGDHITLAANPNYFKGAPKLQKIVYRFIPDDNTALQALLNGETDIDLNTVPEAQVSSLRNNPKVQVAMITYPSRDYIDFNLRRKPMSDLSFRQAVAYAVNREEIVQKATAGISKVAKGMYTPVFSWAFNDEATLPDYDPEKAKQILDQAGYKPDANGVRAKVGLLYFSGTPWESIAAIIKSDLAQVGIDVELKEVDINAYTDMVTQKHDFDLTLLDGFQGPDPDALYNRVGKNGTINVGGYDNPQVDDLLLQAEQLTDQQARGEIYKQVQSLLLADLPILPLAEVVQPIASASYVHGLPWADALGKVTFNDFSLVTLGAH